MKIPFGQTESDWFKKKRPHEKKRGKHEIFYHVVFILTYFIYFTFFSCSIR